MPARNRSIGATVAVVVGVVLCALGLAGAAAGWGSTTKTTIGPATVNGNSSTTIAAPNEDVLKFVQRLGDAIASGDEQFLNARVAVEVIDRYGTPTCVTFFHGSKDPGRRYVPAGQPSSPHDYVYRTDGRETLVHGVLDIPISVQDGSRIASETLEAVPETDASGATTYRFFTDCGEPQR